MLKSDLTDLIESAIINYDNKPTTRHDPNPIIIDNVDTDGPILFYQKQVLCKDCGSLIKNNYFNTHKKSGACYRISRKQSSDYSKPKSW